MGKLNRNNRNIDKDDNMEWQLNNLTHKFSKKLSVGKQKHKILKPTAFKNNKKYNPKRCSKKLNKYFHSVNNDSNEDLCVVIPVVEAQSQPSIIVPSEKYDIDMKAFKDSYKHSLFDFLNSTTIIAPQNSPIPIVF